MPGRKNEGVSKSVSAKKTSRAKKGAPKLPQATTGKIVANVKKTSAPKKKSSVKTTLATKTKKAIRSRQLDDEPASITHALDAIQVGTWQWDTKSNIVTWSKNVRKIFGQVQHSFDGTFESYLEIVPHDDQEKVKNALASSLKNKSNYFIQHRVRWSDGSIHWVEGLGKVILNKKGDTIGMCGTVLDITDFKQSDLEKEDWKIRYEMIAASSAQVVYDYYLQSGKIIWSGILYEVLQYMPDEMGDVNMWVELIHPDDRADALSKLEVAERNLAKYDVTYRFRMKDGNYLLMHDRGFFLADEHGKAYRMLGTMQDITQQKVRDEQISQREQSYRELFDTVSEAIYIHNTDGSFVDVNEGACKMYGYTKEDFIGKGPDFLSAPGLNNLTEIGVKIGLALEGSPQTFEWWGQRKDGSVFLKEVQLAKGSYFGKPVILATAWDITELRNAENILRESEARFRNLIRNLNIGVLLQGPQTEIIISNKTALELLGLSEEQLLGKSSYDHSWRVVHEDGSDFPPADHPVPRAIATGKSVRGVVMGVYRPYQQDLVWLLVNAEPVLNSDQSIREVICTFTDITALKNVQQELRESEQRFRVLQQASFGGIGLHDQGVIIDCNQGLSDITGYSHEELIGMNGLMLIAPEWHHVVINNIRLKLEKPYDVEGLHKNGSRFFMEVHGKNIPYHGKAIRVTEFRDITDRKIAEEKIIEQNVRLQTIMDDLKRKNEQLEEFTQIVSHNLRSPVGNILTLLNFLDGAESPEERLEYIKLLRESGTTTLTTLHELNEVLKIKQNKNVDRQEQHFHKAFALVRSMLSAKIAETNAEIVCHFEEACIDYSRIYLESILLNLLSNALKYIHPNRTPVIQFKTFKKNNYTYLQVSDNGLGINLDRYGHQVFKLRKTFHRHPESRGIGLFMIKNQIEAMGGEITIASKENEGTTFTINLNKNEIDGN